MIHHHPDVAIITETDLKPDEVTQLSVPGYKCASPSVQKQSKIRVLAFIKSDIDVDLETMEPDVPAVSIRLPRLKLSVVGVYRQHHGGLKKPQKTEIASIKMMYQCIYFRLIL